MVIMDGSIRIFASAADLLHIHFHIFFDCCNRMIFVHFFHFFQSLTSFIH